MYFLIFEDDILSRRRLEIGLIDEGDDEMNQTPIIQKVEQLKEKDKVIVYLANGCEVIYSRTVLRKQYTVSARYSVLKQNEESYRLTVMDCLAILSEFLGKIHDMITKDRDIEGFNQYTIKLLEVLNQDKIDPEAEDIKRCLNQVNQILFPIG